MSEKKTSKNFLTGLVIGGAIGAAIALLYAPKTGKEMRQDLKKRTSAILNDAEEYFDLAKNKTFDLINDAKKKSEDLVTHAKIRAESLLEESNELLSKAKEKSYDHEYPEDYNISGLDAYKKEKI